MTYYTVVQTDRKKTPIKHGFMTVEDAANYIARENKRTKWTVLAQNGDARGVYRALSDTERKKMGKILYPGTYPNEL